MKPSGESENASQNIQAQALNLQALGQGGNTLLAHITPAEAQLLHNVTDGGSINPKTGLMEFRYGHSSDDNDSQHGDANAGAQSNDQSSENDAQSGADFSGRESSDNMRTVDYVNARRDEDNARSIERAEARHAQQREIARQKKADEDKRQKEKELKAEEDRQRRVAELQKKDEEEEEQGLLSKSKKTKELYYDDLDAENAREFSDINAGVASDAQAKENERVSERSYEDGRVKVRPLIDYWIPNRTFVPPTRPKDVPEVEVEEGVPDHKDPVRRFKTAKELEAELVGYNNTMKMVVDIARALGLMIGNRARPPLADDGGCVQKRDGTF